MSRFPNVRAHSVFLLVEFSKIALSYGNQHVSGAPMYSLKASMECFTGQEPDDMPEQATTSLASHMCLSASKKKNAGESVGDMLTN